MDSSLLDQNTVSIILSPNKQFYCMAAVDSSDLEQFCTTRDFKLHSNVSGNHSNEMVNGWNLHSNEQDSGDNMNGMTYYQLNEQMPNYEKNCICYPVSSELMSIKSQKSFNVSNGCGNLAIAHNEAFPGLSNISSEAVLGADVAEYRGIVSFNGVSQSKNDIVKTGGGLAELSDPVDVPLALEGCYNPVKPKRSPRKSVKKSKSSYTNFSQSWKNCEQRLNAETETSKQNSIRVKSAMNHESVISKGFSVEPCSSSSGQLSSHPTLSHHGNCVDNSKSENSDGKGDSESSGNEEDILTSGVISTGHESTAIDQIWDGYQVPLYVAISDDSTEERLDATHLLQSEWQPLTDEFMDFSDFGSDCSSLSQHQASEVDSDTDAEEMHHLIKESLDALRLTRASLSQLKPNNGSTVQSSFYREPLATCTTNINCLRDLLHIVSEKGWTHADVNQLSDLLKQWEDVESEFLCLTSQKDLSIAQPDVIIDVSPSAFPFSPICQRFSNSSSDIDMTLMESSSSQSCYFKCSSTNRFEIFNSNVSKLLKTTSRQHENTLAPIQIVFFIMMFFIFLYFIAFRSHWTDVVGIRFEPQLRYVIGPPPF